MSTTGAVAGARTQLREVDRQQPRLERHAERAASVEDLAGPSVKSMQT
ncbi:MAG: hypothetical protein M3071_06610 [Actinomycetota bacterium]|nr:hypothetical protein [Actinomycetota bacterium]